MPRTKQLNPIEVAAVIVACGGTLDEYADSGRAGAWYWRVLEDRIQFGLARLFDRWANSVDFEARLPRNERRLLELLHWIESRGVRMEGEGMGGVVFVRARVDRACIAGANALDLSPYLTPSPSRHPRSGARMRPWRIPYTPPPRLPHRPRNTRRP